MIYGIVNLFCPICAKPIRYDRAGGYYHKEWGVVCSKSCHQEGERKYIKMILGQDEPAAVSFIAPLALEAAK